MYLDVKDLQSGKTSRIEEKGAVLGRGAVDIVIDDPRLAEAHARIYSDKGHWYIEALKSDLGVMVHNAKLTAPVELRFGMRFTMGEHRYEVLIPVGTPISKVQPAAAPAAAKAEPEPAPTQVTKVLGRPPLATPSAPSPVVPAPAPTPAAVVSTASAVTVIAPAPVTVIAPAPAAEAPTETQALVVDTVEPDEPDEPKPEPEPTRLLATHPPAPTRNDPTLASSLRGPERIAVAAGLLSGLFILSALVWSARPAKPVPAAEPASMPASLPVIEQPPEPVPAKLEKPLDPYHAFVKRREAIDRAIESNPLLLKQIEGVLPLYDRLHSELAKIEALAKKKPKKHAKAVEERLREADTFERTQSLVESLYDKLDKAAALSP